MGFRSKRKKIKRKIEDPYTYVSRLLRYRLRSEEELKRKLKERYSEDVAEEVMEKLREKGIVDDERFSYMFALDHLNLYGHGPFYIMKKLRELGVDEDVAKRAVNRALSEFDLENFLKRLYLRFEDKKKLRDYLFKRGFDPSILDNVDL